MIKGIYSVLLVIGVYACNGCMEQRRPVPLQRDYSEDLIEANRQKVQAEMQDISRYVAAEKWPAIESATGLYYWIYQGGEGRNAQKGDHVSLEYSISDIKGQLFYDSASNGPLLFAVDQDEVVSGLHEVVKYMNLGARVKAIFPSHLGYGFTGDQQKIDPNTILVFDLHLYEIQ